MPKVVAVAFPFVTRTLWFSPEGLEVPPEELASGTEVICKTARGEELGITQDKPFEVDDKKLKETIGDAKLSNIVRIATGSDSKKHDELVEKAFANLPRFREYVKELKLPIKPVGIEYTVDGKTAVCFFAAEERVDFRELVKKLARALDAKIDMRQIGVREEAGSIGGYAQCGQQLCCSRWEKDFAPISIRMAKEQDLPLNSPKISGVCGRLMCCLRYEFDAYKDFKKRAPKVGATITTPAGDAKVTSLDTPREIITMRLDEDKTINVPLKFLSSLTNEGKQAAARPNTMTKQNWESYQRYEEERSLAQENPFGGGFAGGFGVSIQDNNTSSFGASSVAFSRGAQEHSGITSENATMHEGRVASGLAPEDELSSAGNDSERKENGRNKRDKKRRKNRPRKRQQNQRGVGDSASTGDGSSASKGLGGSSRSRKDNRRKNRQGQNPVPQNATRRRRRPGDKGQGAPEASSVAIPAQADGSSAAPRRRRHHQQVSE